MMNGDPLCRRQSEFTIKGRLLLGLAWLMVGVVCVASMMAAYGLLPHGGGKSMTRIQDEWWMYKMAWMLLSILVAGAFFGAAIGALRGRVGAWPIVGVFVWPVALCVWMIATR